VRERPVEYVAAHEPRLWRARGPPPPPLEQEVGK